MKKVLLKKNFNECIGNTPLIKLNRASELSGNNIYGKCEFLNPGGSVKDRPALQIIKDALNKNEIVQSRYDSYLSMLDKNTNYRKNNYK